jgi:hypothetical protein
MATSIRISLDIPDPKKIIAEGIKKKNSAIDRVDVSLTLGGTSSVTCTYDEKKYPSFDRYKLERELKDIIAKLGYKIR